jgi:hypothetical protein
MQFACSQKAAINTGAYMLKGNYDHKARVELSTSSLMITTSLTTGQGSATDGSP